jgi:hypothetical protein
MADLRCDVCGYRTDWEYTETYHCKDSVFVMCSSCREDFLEETFKNMSKDDVCGAVRAKLDYHADADKS